LPRAKALDIAGQIVQGLAAAHAKGIVHRDLKPENIFLTGDGRVKVLDFGLARAVPGAAQAISEVQTAMSPQAAGTAGASVPGLILGTAGYMAPEQVRGHVADHRADIFSFGAVLYEMLTGARAFGGESAIEMMGGILTQDPLEDPASTIGLTGPLEALLRHCLEKQPDERFQSARDLAFQLNVIASGGSSWSAAGLAAPPAERPRTVRRLMVPALIAVVAAGAGLGLGRYLFSERPREFTGLTSALLLPPDVRVDPGASPARSGGLAVSADGRQIAFVGRSATGFQIFVRAVDSGVARPVAGTEGGILPAWAPDGRRLAFVAEGKLKQVPSDGGAAQVIADLPNPRSAATWGPDDTLLFHTDYRQALSRVSAAGGPPAEVLPALGEGISWFSPVWLPDGRRFLVVRFTYSDDTADGAGIYAGSIESTDLTLLVPGRIAEVALGADEIFYRRGTDLVAQPFDQTTLTLSGSPRVISTHVSMAAAGGPTLVYWDPPRGLSFGYQIAWFSRAGAVITTTGSMATYRDPRISPDGRSLAIARADENGLFGIWKYDIARNVDSRVTGTTFVSPTWSRDSRSLVIGSQAGVFRYDADAVTPPQLVRVLKTFGNVQDTSPDGREALIMTSGSGPSLPSVMPLDGSGDPLPIASGGFTRTYGAFSPDGRWIALSTTEGALTRLHVQPHPGPGARIPVTTLPVLFPRWRGDGRELYGLTQQDGQTAIVAIPVTWAGAAPDFGAPQVLFTVPRIVPSNHGFDVTADGQRFVAVIRGDLDPSPLTMVVRAVVR
jgi:eukaryotic-like serine/threonine-protein kinase